MSVLVRIGRKKAILCGGKWSSADPRVEDQLQNSLDMWVQNTGGPPLGHRDPDQFAADAIRSDLGYEVLIASKPKGRTAQTAYFSKRQMALPF
ncbi:hypothetical protein [Bryobacter aggregatus]|uniref:hypothetical protein n=1 Tax=Bryobacter aggregatus TaxID=360054 RepID=UPI0004E13737|nr:hypothetical protein [Bryobacter aggregatus]